MKLKDTTQSQIILVEDNPDHLELVLQAFRRTLPGRRIRYFCSGQEVLQFIREQTSTALLQEPEIELVILDLDLPDIDGHVVLEHLKQNRLFRHVPVVILSNVDSQGDIDRALAYGAEDYIIKPFAFKDLSLTIQKIVNQFCCCP